MSKSTKTPSAASTKAPVKFVSEPDDDFDSDSEPRSPPASGGERAKSPLPPLQGFESKYLRGLAHSLKPVVQIGQRGLTDEVMDAVDEALLAHELIKVRLTRPEDKKSSAQDLAARAGAHLAGLIGHTVILYRAHPEEPRIVLPRRPGGALESPGRDEIEDDDTDEDDSAE